MGIVLDSCPLGLSVASKRTGPPLDSGEAVPRCSCNGADCKAGIGAHMAAAHPAGPEGLFAHALPAEMVLPVSA